MPPRFIPRTIIDFIYYYYAKLIISPSAGQQNNYRFIIDRYKRLKNGEIQISDYDREIQKLAHEPGTCAFCGKHCETVPIELIPRRLGGPVGIQNIVHACTDCAQSKDDKDLLTWWCDELGNNKDSLPRVPAGLFLKMAYELHQISFTLKKRCENIREIWPKEHS